MPLTASVKSGLTITRPMTSAKLETLALAQRYFYPHYPTTNEKGDIIPFSDLTQAQRDEIIERHFAQVIKDAAQAQRAQDAQEAAKSGQTELEF